MSRDDGLLVVEQQLLHTALVRPSTLMDMPLQAKHFSSELYGELWGYICERNMDGRAADFIVIGEAAEREGRLTIRDMAMDIACDGGLVPTTDGAFLSSIVVNAWRTREAAHIGRVLVDSAAKRDAASIDTAITSLMGLHADDRECEQTTKTAMAAAWQQVMAAHQSGGALTGVPSGLAELDDTLGGFHDSDLIIVGARPAMGKTGLLLGMTLAASESRAIGLISGEQPHEQVGLRWMAAGSGVSVGKLRAAKIEEDQWAGLTESIRRFQDRPIRILDRSSPDVAEVCRVARRWKHQYGIKALYIDYLQRLEMASMAKAPRHERIGAIAKTLKNLARDLNIPVIALAQVNRKVEERVNQRPMMSDLADSGEIEKEADQIMTLWRDVTDARAYSPAEINVVKNRHGNIGTVHCKWHGASTSFVNMDRAA